MDEGEGSDGNEPPIVTAAVGVEKVGAAARAEPRVVDPVAADPRASELVLVAAQRSSIHLPAPTDLTQAPHRPGKAASSLAITGLSTS